MTGRRILLGFEPDRRGADALALAAAVARHTGGDLLVGQIRTPAWQVPGPGNVDAEWERYLDDQARASLARAGADLAELGLEPVEYLVGDSRGSGRGLGRLASRHKADLIVIGSAPGGPRTGIHLGSTADQLLHGSPVPVMIAPKNYAARGITEFDRVTVAYLRRPDADAAVLLAAEMAAARGVPLRLLTFAVGHSPKGKAASVLAEEQLRRMVDRIESDLAVAAQEAASGSGMATSQIRTEVAAGPGAARAVGAADWSQGELLVCSSSDSGPIRKVFMGDMSLKIIRAAPCPVVVLPRLVR